MRANWSSVNAWHPVIPKAPQSVVGGFVPFPKAGLTGFTYIIINWGCNYSRSGSRASKHLSNIMETDERQIPFSRFFVDLCLAQCLQFKILKFLFPNLNFPILETKLWIMI